MNMPEADKAWLKEFYEKHKSVDRPLVNREPTEEEISICMESDSLTYYGAREKLREKSYGGKPPGGFQSWGDYHKTI